MQISNRPVQPPTQPSGNPPAGGPGTPAPAAEAQEACAVDDTCAAEAPAEASDETKGLLDYAKMPFVAATEFAAKGQARNMVEMIDDFDQAGDHFRELGSEVSQGHLGQALGAGFRAIGHSLKGVVDTAEAGMFATVGGLSMIPTAVVNGADGLAESLGQVGEEQKSGLQKGLGSIGRALGGSNSHVGYVQMVQDAAQEETFKTRAKLQDD